MALNMEKHYFKHDFLADEDSKLQDLLYELGNEGYGIYWRIVERLYRQNGTVEYNLKRLSYNIRVDENTIKKVCEDFGLFVIKDGQLSSNRVSREIQEYNNIVEQRKKASRAAAEARRRQQNDGQMSMNLPPSDEQNNKNNLPNDISNDSNKISNDISNGKNTKQNEISNDENNSSSDISNDKPLDNKNTSTSSSNEPPIILDNIKSDNIKLNENNSLSLSPSLSEENGGEATEKERGYLNIYYQFFLLNRKNPDKETGRFIDHYSSQDWRKSNGQKITNVAAAVRLWRCDDMDARFPKKFVDFIAKLIEKTGMKQRTAFVSMIEDFKFDESESSYILQCKKPIYDFIETHIDVAVEIAKDTFGKKFNLKYKITKSKDE